MVVQKLWRNFFPGDPEPMSLDDQCVRMAEIFYDFFRDASRGKPLLSRAEWVNNGNVYLDCLALESLLKLDDFRTHLQQKPREVLGTLGLSLGLLAVSEQRCKPGNPLVLYPRLVNLEPAETPFDRLRSGIVGQFVSLRGYVVKVGPPRPLIEGAAFECQSCCYSQWLRFEDGLFVQPEICRGTREDKNGKTVPCRAKYPVINRSKCKSTAYQRIKLQELDRHRSAALAPHSSATEAEESQARIPRTFEVEARSTLVNRCVPGNIVQVVGLLQSSQLDGGRGKQARDSALCSLYLLANTIQVVKGATPISEASCAPGVGSAATATATTIDQSLPLHLQQQPPCAFLALDCSGSSIPDLASAGGGGSQDVFSPEELRRIAEIACSDNCLSLLVASLCPSIFGHELVKMGLLLGLLGGTARSYSVSSDSSSSGSGSSAAALREHSSADPDALNENNPQSVRVRSDVHVLIVGDPGLGKSQMLRAAAAAAPRSVLVCGNTATTAGLTVTVTREGHGEVALEAGALVLADQGVCCLDELDKMTCDHHALLEAMEQQSISVAKSGMVASIRTRTTVLAAANPSQGHYNRHRSVCDNLKMPGALLSRFDLIFILRDKRDVQHDKMVAKHILHTHAMSRSGVDGDVAGAGAGVGVGAMSSAASAFPAMNDDEDESNLTVSQRLRRHCAEFARTGACVPPDLLRRYIEYARKHAHPQLTRKAAAVLQRLYLTMRSQASLGKSIPVTTRNLESLIRLGQARARAELRETVTEQDAKDVVDLLHESLLDAFTAESGELGGGPGGELGLYTKAGTMRGATHQMKALVTALKEESRAMDGKRIFHTNEIAALCQRLKLEKPPTELIDKLHSENYLLQKPNKSFELSFV